MALRRRFRALPVAAALVTTALTVLALLAGNTAVRDLRAPRTAAGASASYDHLPIGFAPGEPGSPARFLATGPGYTLFLTEHGSVLTLTRGHGQRAAVLRTSLAGATPRAPRAERPLPGKLFIYHGAKQRENLPTYARIRYDDVYPGIDATYHGTQSRLEYDFEVRPGADPSRIALGVAGARSLRLTPGGALLLSVPGGALRESRPVAYQAIDGRRVPVPADFDVQGTTVRFRLGAYDRK